MIIGLIIGIVFFFLLSKAILETLWGSCLITFGIFCQILAGLLCAEAYLLELFDKISHAYQKRPPT